MKVLLVVIDAASPRVFAPRCSWPASAPQTGSLSKPRTGLLSERRLQQNAHTP